jgi:hypothetical protein
MELYSGAKMVNDYYLKTNNVRSKNREFTVQPNRISSSSSGTELLLIAESSDISTTSSHLPRFRTQMIRVFNLHLTNILFNVILPTVLGSFL